MKISFTTLGCPGWDLDTICRRAVADGYDGVDLRGYLDTLDVTTLPAFTTQAEPTRRQLADAGLAVSAISSSITVCMADLHQRNLDEARRTIACANALGAGCVRIFGGGDLAKQPHPAWAETGRQMIAEILVLNGARQLKWLFETHDIWLRAAEVKLLLDHIPDPAFGVLWDMGHTPRVVKEPPEQTVAAYAARIGYTHIKDAVYAPGHPLAMEDGWRYVMPGEGELPLTQAVRLLHGCGYDGWLTFEHEKRWLPNLPEPEQAFPAFARWARATLAEIG